MAWLTQWLNNINNENAGVNDYNVQLLICSNVNKWLCGVMAAESNGIE